MAGQRSEGRPRGQPLAVSSPRNHCADCPYPRAPARAFAGDSTRERVLRIWTIPRSGNKVPAAIDREAVPDRGDVQIPAGSVLSAGAGRNLVLGENTGGALN